MVEKGAEEGKLLAVWEGGRGRGEGGGVDIRSWVHLRALIIFI